MTTIVDLEASTTIAPPVPESKPIYEPGKKLETSVRRIGAHEMQTEFGQWLSGRCQEVFGCSDRGFHMTVRNYTDSNHYFFSRTDDAVILASMIPQPFGQVPVVEVMLLFTRDWAREQAITLLTEAMRWAKMLGASEFVYRGPCDASPSQREKAKLPGVKRGQYFVPSESL